MVVLPASLSRVLRVCRSFLCRHDGCLMSIDPRSYRALFAALTAGGTSHQRAAPA